MKKSDKSIHNISIASIKRSTIKPYDFNCTRFYEEHTAFKNAYPEIEIGFSSTELVICSTVIDKNNFSVLTTQKLITKEKGILLSSNLNGASVKAYGDFKGYKKDSFTFGIIHLADGNEFKYFIETGRASMVMIHGVKTRIQVNAMTDSQVIKVAAIWTGKTDSSSNPSNSTI
ncbi:hypothetical protein [Chitinophaga sp. sic0106]|uniref:hypothetical protein n=1 Tax=Chitinophaga sp. sic0106 TaxID=2854785 RepID=UPI001C48901D|nr:hypothetical protein [Chitinophaga sp. sic0106]MBV7532439.1 hypothetical protein [Chitinophaga sp. sic0106]